MKNKKVDPLAGELISAAKRIFSFLKKQPEEERIEIINQLRIELHKHSPFSIEPVDCVVWVKAEKVIANDYNPNSVAPPEMKLLEHSITEDGYTQPIVSWRNGNHYEVVDGFHRNRVSRECKAVRDRVKGYLPLTIINSGRQDRNDRIAATIRHNRARGKHKIDAMSEIVVELKRRNWSNERIGKELGMDPDEVLRLTQISGLTEMFANKEFSEAWEHTGKLAEGEIESIDDEDGEEINLEWMTSSIPSNRTSGWNDRSDDSSVLYGAKGNYLAVIQKSRFVENEWFLYVYCKPMQEAKAKSKKEAKKISEKILETYKIKNDKT